MLTLVIGNKAYSSWSLRPWLLLQVFGIPFEEKLVPLDQPDTKARILAFSGAGKVPVLIDGDVTVWESIAIMDYVAARFPLHPIWPDSIAAKGLALAMSAEMHAGFSALRQACPMNLRKRHPPRDRGEGVAKDVERITTLWREARDRFGTGGPFLFGDFSAADAMYAPVVTRFATYSIEVDPVSRAYMDAILSLPAFRAWQAAGMAETWVLDHDEADEPVAGPFPLPA
jgi:glutathione S-transferase